MKLLGNVALRLAEAGQVGVESTHVLIHQAGALPAVLRPDPFQDHGEFQGTVDDGRLAFQEQ
jgi:hypothetical protein